MEIGTLLDLLDPAEGWTPQRIHRAAKRIGVRHRNANDPLGSCLAPEQLMLEELDGCDPVDRVQAIFRRHPTFTEAAALATLHDYRDALARFPGLIECRPSPRRLKPTPFLRGPAAKIEAARSTYKFIDQKKARAA